MPKTITNTLNSNKHTSKYNINKKNDKTTVATSTVNTIMEDDESIKNNKTE